MDYYTNPFAHSFIHSLLDKRAHVGIQGLRGQGFGV